MNPCKSFQELALVRCLRRAPESRCQKRCMGTMCQRFNLMRIARLSVAVLLTTLRTQVAAQDAADDLTLDSASRGAVIDGTLRELNDFNIWPDVASKMAEALRKRLRRNGCETVTNARSFAEVVLGTSGS